MRINDRLFFCYKLTSYIRNEGNIVCCLDLVDQIEVLNIFARIEGMKN